MRQIRAIIFAVLAVLCHQLGKTAAYALLWALVIALLFAVGRLTVVWLGSSWLAITLPVAILLMFPF